MMDINELATHLGGEIVGGRLLAVVGGSKQYLSGADGALNELGLRVANEISLSQAAKVEPARRGRPRKESVEPESDI